MADVPEQIGSCQVVREIGRGGMGVVYLGIDTRLEREVAIKSLPDDLAADPDRLDRFQREAKLLASLNHPNIAGVYGLEESKGRTYLMLEYVTGEDLSDQLARGALSLDTALQTAAQVASALEAAHSKGVIHRDLKPSNIKVMPDGTVKVLDFGLAKMVGDAPSSISSADSPTLRAGASPTIPGMVLGTAGYMSPEQARGRAVDRRSDVFSFGCLLHEMLTGSSPFVGDTITDSVAATLHVHPDFDDLPPGTPPGIRRLLRRCLAKDPAHRLHDIADARIEIEDAFSAEEPAPLANKSRRPLVLWAVTAIVGLAAIGGLDVVLRGRGSPGESSLHLSVTLPQKLELIGGSGGEPIPAISPDGQRLVFSAREDDTGRLYLRRVDSPEVVPLPGTEGGTTPFFSPDGLWVGFFAGGKLKKVSVQGGTPVDVCDAPSNRGGAWSADGTIVFSPTFNGGLARVSAGGGDVESVTAPDPERNERTHRWPAILPGGKAAVFTIGSKDKPGNYEDAAIAVADLATGEVRTVIEGGSIARYAPTGHLIYSRQRTLLAVPFDVERLEVTGPPVLVLEGVAGDQTSGAVHFDVAGNATLMYMPEATSLSTHTLVWVDREGRPQRSREVPRCPLVGPKLSPDGKRAAVTLGLGPGEGDVWIHDSDRDKLTRVTFHNSAIGPIWTSDGTRVTYGLTAGGMEGIGWKSADGAGVEQLIARESGEFAAIPEAWLPEERTLLYSRFGGKGGSDIMALDVGSGEITPVLDGPFSEGGATLSPDGKWMAYASDESGRFEVYVRPYPGPGGKWQISTEGGRGPIWSRHGEALYYTHGERMMVAPVGTEPSFSAGTPQKLFEYPFVRNVGPWADYDVSPDGQVFLMTQRPKGAPVPRQINLVTRFMVDRPPQ